MKVLIIGGLSELGSYIIKMLYDSNDDTKIDVVDIKIEDKVNSDHKINEYIRCDRNNYYEFKKCMECRKYDVVIDLIAFSRSDINNIKDIFGGKIIQYIFLSTFEIYKFEKSRTFFDENLVDSNYIDKLLKEINILDCTDNQLYPIGKMQCEKMLMDDNGATFNYTIFRPVNYYSKKDKYKHLNWIKERVKSGEILIPMSLLKNNTIIRPIYIEEFSNIICGSILNKSCYNNIFNVAQEEIISYTHLLNEIAYYFKVNLKFIIVEDKLIKNRIIGYKIPIPHNEILNINNIKNYICYRKYSLDEWIPKVFDDLQDRNITDDTLEEEKRLIIDLMISQRYSLDVLTKVEIGMED